MLLLVAVAAAAVVAAGVAAIAGFGIGSLLTPVVALAYGTKLAVVLVAVPHFAATALRTWMLRAHIRRRVLLTFGAASAGGGIIGAILHGQFGSRSLSVLLGILLIFSGVSGLVGVSGRLRMSGRSVSVVAGALSGAFGGLVGNQGGIRTAALLHFGLGRLELVATATAIGLAVDMARLPVYLVTAGDGLLANWPLVAVATAAALGGTTLATPVLRRLPELVFRRVVFGLVLLLGLGFVVGWVG